MARVHLLLCFTILFASVTHLEVISAHVDIKATLPQIEDPKTVKDVEPYTVNVVMVFVSDLEKKCPKTNKFKAFFERLRGFAKYVCPIKRTSQKDYDSDMKVKAGSLFQSISSFAVGKIREKIQTEKNEAINNLKMMKSMVGKILGGRKKDESEESMKLTPENLKEIKEGILKWEIVITKITNTMLESTTSSSSSQESKTTVKGSSTSSSGSGTSSLSGGNTFKDTTGSSESPSSSPYGSETSFTDTSVQSETKFSPSSTIVGPPSSIGKAKPN